MLDVMHSVSCGQPVVNCAAALALVMVAPENLLPLVLPLLSVVERFAHLGYFLHRVPLVCFHILPPCGEATAPMQSAAASLLEVMWRKNKTNLKPNPKGLMESRSPSAFHNTTIQCFYITFYHMFIRVIFRARGTNGTRDKHFYIHTRVSAYAQ